MFVHCVIQYGHDKKLHSMQWISVGILPIPNKIKFKPAYPLDINYKIKIK